MKRCILVISKDDAIGNVIEENLANDFTTVICVKSTISALEMIMQYCYSLIILDLLVSDMKWSVLLQIIRKLSNTPIMVLTPQAELKDRIGMIAVGADDCLVWPVIIDELVLRVETWTRKEIKRLDLVAVVNKNIGLFISPGRRIVEIKEEEVVLTKREFDILYLLASNPDVVFSKEKLYALIWNNKFVKDDSNIMSHIGRLRKKMGDAGKHIQTVWGIGYRFSEYE